MEWSKLKNIVLLLLLTTNLCLLAFLVNHQWRREQQLQDARAQAIEFLAAKDIKAAPGQIPEKMTLLPQTAVRDLDGEAAAARALLGENMYVEHRGGEIYRYFGDRGSVQFHADGTFSADFEPGAFPLGEDRETACRELLAKLGFHAGLVAQRGNKLTFRQSWENIPLFSQQVTAVCDETSVLALTSGRRLPGTPQPDPSRQTVTVATAIFDFYNGLGLLGDVCSRIDAIDRGYISTSSLTAPTVLTPVWRIDTDTGRYQLDTVTGALSRIS